jgi:hypothetical protein
MHIRQIALVARELDTVVADLCAVFDLEVGFRDPGVGQFGLVNAVMPVGDSFLEVVSPERDVTTAGRFLERRGGDGGYMVILQTSDMVSDRARLDQLGVRIVWQIELDDIRTLHLHPRDVGGTLLSLDQPNPPEAWRWGGPEWTSKRRSGVIGSISGATIEARDPVAMAERWAAVLGLSLQQGAVAPTLALDPGAIDFVPEAGRGEGLSAVRMAPLDAGRALAEAKKRDLFVDGSRIKVGGTWFELG